MSQNIPSKALHTSLDTLMIDALAINNISIPDEVQGFFFLFLKSFVLTKLLLDLDFIKAYL